MFSLRQISTFYSSGMISQILDIINNQLTSGQICDMHDDSHIEPDPAVVLEAHAVVSLVHGIWAKEFTWGVAKH